MDDIGTGEIPALKYVTSAKIARPASLRRLLDELDPPSAAVIVRTAAGETEAKRVLHTLGYSGNGSPVTVVRGAAPGAVHTVILYEAPVRRSEISVLTSSGTVNVVTLVQPSELPALREMIGGKLAALNFSSGASKLRRRDDAMRSELRSVLSSGIPPREIAPLEPLLAAPVRVGELLLAKSLASAIPAVIVTWIAYAIYLGSVSILGSAAAVRAVTAPRWILAIVIMVPLLTLLSVNLGILISTRVNDVRVAQQIGGLVVVPVVGIGILQVTGRVVLNNESFLGTAVFLLVCDVLVFFFARLAFQRENILSRWR